jgi:hypothetical protein
MKSTFSAQLSAFGVTLHFEGENGYLSAALSQCLLPGWELASRDCQPDALVEIRQTCGGFAIVVDGESGISESFEPGQLDRALNQIVHLKIAELSPQAVFIHAGVVAWRGRAIVIPGRSMTGKSTLTRALVLAGATYYSDEFAPVLPDGRVAPYPKPLSCRQVTGQPELLPASDLGWHRLLPAIPVAAIAAVSYRPDDPCTSFSEISRAEAATALLDNTVPMLRAPRRSLEAASTLARSALCLGGGRSEAVGSQRLSSAGCKLSSNSARLFAKRLPAADRNLRPCNCNPQTTNSCSRAGTSPREASSHRSFK